MDPALDIEDLESVASRARGEQDEGGVVELDTTGEIEVSERTPVGNGGMQVGGCEVGAVREQQIAEGCPRMCEETTE